MTVKAEITEQVINSSGIITEDFRSFLRSNIVTNAGTGHIICALQLLLNLSSDENAHVKLGETLKLHYIALIQQQKTSRVKSVNKRS